MSALAQALKSASEEYSQLLDAMGRYAGAPAHLGASAQRSIAPPLCSRPPPPPPPPALYAHTQSSMLASPCRAGARARHALICTRWQGLRAWRPSGACWASASMPRQGACVPARMPLPAHHLCWRRAVYGAPVAKHVLPLSLECGEGVGEGAGEDELSCKVEVSATFARGLRLCRGSCLAPRPSNALLLAMQGFVSGADYAGKRTQLVLFINARSGVSLCWGTAARAAAAAVRLRTAQPLARACRSGMHAAQARSRGGVRHAPAQGRQAVCVPGP